MKIEIEIAGTVDVSLLNDYEKRGKAENYPNGIGLYGVMNSDGNIVGFVGVENIVNKTDEVGYNIWHLPPNTIIKTAINKETQNLAVSFSEAVCKINDIVSTEKANQKACLEHIEHLLENIAKNRGDGISEETLLEALRIVGNKENK